MIASAASAASWAIGSPDREPLGIPYDVPEYLAGTDAAAAAVTGVLLRDAGVPIRTLGVSTVSTLAYYIGMANSNFGPYGRTWRRDGARAAGSSGFYPAAQFRCRDGWVTITCRQPSEWANLRRAMEDPPWSREDRFADGRVVAARYADEADTYLSAWTANLTQQELFGLGRSFGFPVIPVSTVRQALDEPQFAAREFIRALAGHDESISLPGPPCRVITETRAQPRPPRREPVSATRPLAGLRVVDFTWVWSGPTVTAGLADLGATVLKIEHPAHYDPARVRGRGRRPDGTGYDGPEIETSPYFNQLNRGKRSLEIDLTTESGAATIRDLVRDSDVLVESMRPGVLGRRGLDWAALRAINPSLVMCSMTVVGQGGPLSSMKGYASVMSGMAGLDTLVGYPDGLATGMLNLSLGDPNASGHALAYLLAAIRRQRTTGHGAYLDLSQTECLLAVMREPVVAAQTSTPDGPMGNQHTSFWPHGHFPTADPDGWLAIVARNGEERAALATVVASAWPVEPETLAAATRTWARGHGGPDAERALREAGVPVSVVRSHQQVVDGDWAAASRFHTPVEHPYLGRQDIVALPWSIDEEHLTPSTAAPLLGADTDATIAEITASAVAGWVG